MPFLAPVAAALMTTAGSTLAAGAIGAGASLYASSQQAGAARDSAQASQRAADQATALQQQALDATTKNNAPYLQAGYSALDALTAQYGLGPRGGQAGQPDWNAYVAQNADVQAIQDIADGKAQGTQDQLNFLHDYQAKGAPQGMSLGQYHASVVPGRVIPTTAAPTAEAAQPGQQEAVPGAPAPYAAPAEYAAPPRPNMAPLDISLDKYTPSPDYQYQLSEGNKNLNSGYAAKGMLQSGAAMKALQDYGAQKALGDYSQWRDYVTGQYNMDRNVLNTNYDQDRNYGQNQYVDARNFGRSVYDSDRTYATGRADTTTNNLFKIAGIGQSSANNTSAAGQTFANNSGNLLTNNAENQGAAYNQVADANASGVGAIAGTAQNLLKYFSPVATTAQAPITTYPYVPAQTYNPLKLNRTAANPSWSTGS